jgi:TldD protein
MGSLLGACGGKAKRSTSRTGSGRRSLEDIRRQMRELVTLLRRRYDEASALARTSWRGGAAADDGERGANREHNGWMVLRVRSGARAYERLTNDLSSGGMAVAARDLAARAPAGKGGTIELGAPVTHNSRLTLDPARSTPSRWLNRVEALRDKAGDIGGSRIVYRGAYMTVDDEHTLFVGDRRDLAQRLVRTRAGLLLVAWTGSSPTVDEAVRAGVMGLEATDIGAGEIRAAATRALALLTARPAPARKGTVVLDPTVGALLVHSCLGAVLEADSWVAGANRMAALVGKQGKGAVGSRHITVIDDPRPTAGFGGYFFDDEGRAAAPTAVIERGVLSCPLSDSSSAAVLRTRPTPNARRHGVARRLAPRRSNLALRGGTGTHDDLIASVRDGLLLEGGMSARVDPRTLRFSIQCARAREIRRGSLSGVLFGTVDLRGDLLEVLRATTQVSDDRQSFPGNAGPEGDLASSMTSPYILTRAEVA